MKTGDPENLRAERAFRYCLAVAAGWHLLCLISLPLLITSDGHWYIRLAEVVGTPRFPGEWDFLRGPLYPAIVKAGFWLTGEHAVSVVAVQTVMSLFGIFLLADLIRRADYGYLGAAVLLLLAFYPTLIAYVHCLLTETGTFLFLALLIYLPCRGDALHWPKTVLIAIALGAGYYHRASLLYLAPSVSAVILLQSFWNRNCARSMARSKRAALLRGLPHAAALVVIPWLIAYPWARSSNVDSRLSQSVVAYGLVKQAVIPPDHPIWEGSASDYTHAIQASLVDGRLPLCGLRNGSEYTPLNRIIGRATSGENLLREVLQDHPGEYFAAVLRTLLFYAGFQREYSDSALYRSRILSSGPASNLDPAPEAHFPLLEQRFGQRLGDSFVLRTVAAFAPGYDAMVTPASMATVVILLIGLTRRQTPLVALGVVPLAHLLLYALFLNAQDRMAFPAYPIMIVNLLLLAAVLLQSGASRLSGNGEGSHVLRKLVPLGFLKGRLLQRAKPSRSLRSRASAGKDMVDS